MIFSIRILIILQTFFFFSFLKVSVFKRTWNYFLFINIIISTKNILSLFLVTIFCLLFVNIFIWILKLFFISWISWIFTFLFICIIVLVYIPKSIFETSWSFCLILILLITHWEIDLWLIFNSSFLIKTFLERYLTSKWGIH